MSSREPTPSFLLPLFCMPLARTVKVPIPGPVMRSLMSLVVKAKLFIEYVLGLVIVILPSALNTTLIVFTSMGYALLTYKLVLIFPSIVPSVRGQGEARDKLTERGLCTFPPDDAGNVFPELQCMVNFFCVAGGGLPFGVLLPALGGGVLLTICCLSGVEGDFFTRVKYPTTATMATITTTKIIFINPF